MAYSLEITDKALAEIEEALAFRVQRSIATGVRWYVKLMDAVRTLPDNPERWPLAAESEWHPGIREMIFGKKRNVYRILFEIRGDTIYVVRVRHVAQISLEAGDL